MAGAGSEQSRSRSNQRKKSKLQNIKPIWSDRVRLRLRVCGRATVLLHQTERQRPRKTKQELRSRKSDGCICLRLASQTIGRVWNKLRWPPFFFALASVFTHPITSGSKTRARTQTERIRKVEQFSNRSKSKRRQRLLRLLGFFRSNAHS